MTVPSTLSPASVQAAGTGTLVAIAGRRIAADSAGPG
jgi:hypothetical protein